MKRTTFVIVVVAAIAALAFAACGPSRYKNPDFFYGNLTSKLAPLDGIAQNACTLGSNGHTNTVAYGEAVRAYIDAEGVYDKAVAEADYNWEHSTPFTDVKGAEERAKLEIPTKAPTLEEQFKSKCPALLSP